MSESEKKFRVGYTQGTFDMFHVGHLNILKNASAMCERLIVGVNADELVEKYKNKTPVISEKNRLEIVRAIRYVDEAELTYTLDKATALKLHKFDAVFIGDDWKGSERWAQTERELAPLGTEVVYLKHTDGVSSTELRPFENERVSD